MTNVERKVFAANIREESDPFFQKKAIDEYRRTAYGIEIPKHVCFLAYMSRRFFKLLSELEEGTDSWEDVYELSNRIDDEIGDALFPQRDDDRIPLELSREWDQLAVDIAADNILAASYCQYHLANCL